MSIATKLSFWSFLNITTCNHAQTQVNHLGHLRSLIDAQKAFYTECLSQLTEVEVGPATDMDIPSGM